MDRRIHKQYLDYRDCHAYFGRKKPLLAAAEFERLDAEVATLQALGEHRDDEEEARLHALMELLHRK